MMHITSYHEKNSDFQFSSSFSGSRLSTGSLPSMVGKIYLNSNSNIQNNYCQDIVQHEEENLCYQQDTSSPEIIDSDHIIEENKDTSNTQMNHLLSKVAGQEKKAPKQKDKDHPDSLIF